MPYDPITDEYFVIDTKSHRQKFMASFNTMSLFYKFVSSEEFLKNVKPVFESASNNPTAENVANMMQIARDNAPDNLYYTTQRGLLAHAMWAELPGQNIGLYAQDKVAQGLGSQNARHAAIASMKNVLDNVEKGYKPGQHFL